MNAAFDTIASIRELPRRASDELRHRGFTVLPDVISRDRIERLRVAYDAAVASASQADVKVGTTSTRVTDFVNRGEEFDSLYVYQPLLQACSEVIERSFKLSSFHARTLHAHVPNGDFHADVKRNSRDWPLLSFIFMIDDFRIDNGATRFIPGSHAWHSAPENSLSDLRADHEDQVLACGAAGSLLMFNGSVWHDHSANRTDKSRRSIQGAFIPRDGRAATDFSHRMQPETRARLSALAHYVLGSESGGES